MSILLVEFSSLLDVFYQLFLLTSVYTAPFIMENCPQDLEHNTNCEASHPLKDLIDAVQLWHVVLCMHFPMICLSSVHLHLH